ncbi:MAG TPA: hypothetical protein VGL75_10925 [Acidothermaceae bacterium]|jgi:hypothetical protein
MEKFWRRCRAIAPTLEATGLAVLAAVVAQFMSGAVRLALFVAAGALLVAGAAFLKRWRVAAEPSPVAPAGVAASGFVAGNVYDSDFEDNTTDGDAFVVGDVTRSRFRRNTHGRGQ